MKIMNMFSWIKTAITGTMSIAPLRIHKTKSAALLTLIVCIASAFTSFAANPYLVRTFEKNGRLIDEIIVPPSPPPAIKVQAAAVPEPNAAAGINALDSVPAFTWCYGCSATSAGMMMGYYDNKWCPNMYTGPANGGVCPMNNEIYWGHTVWPGGTNGECPLVATHIGKDGRTTRGHVEDYWIDINNPGPDPYIVNGWTEHTAADCTGDFMGTSQSKFGNADGSTTFYFNNDNSPLSDYTDNEPAKRDGCHGMKLFVNSRGYTVTANFSQYIAGYNGKAAGFSYANFKTEIDAGRPVIIQVEGHTMLGYGYNDSGNIIYIHDTWDNSNHQMPWGGSYSGMPHYGVTVLQIQGAQYFGPVIKANGLTNNITISHSDSLSITIQLDPAQYLGTPCDWWVVARAGSSSWIYMDSKAQWQTEGAWRPMYQGGLFNLPATQVWGYGLPVGSYTFYFILAYPMDGLLDGALWYDSVNVTVQ